MDNPRVFLRTILEERQEELRQLVYSESEFPPALNPFSLLSDVEARIGLLDHLEADTHDESAMLAYEQVVRWLASAYESHPLYREEWRPLR